MQETTKAGSQTVLEQVRLTALMERTAGRPAVKVALIDGPVATRHADLEGALIQQALPGVPAACSVSRSFGCMHGTFTAGILFARRGSGSPAICPDCTMLVRPIFPESGQDPRAFMPAATPEQLAAAIVDCVRAGAHVVNLSLALAQPSMRGETALEQALDFAARRGTLVVVAAGNQGALGSTALVRHTWVIPVVACGNDGRPLPMSNLAASVGRRGLGAPGDDVTSLNSTGGTMTSGGTSVAAPFVSGAIALLLSEFPGATAQQVRAAVTQSEARRTCIVPPLLDGRASYIRLQQQRRNH